MKKRTLFLIYLLIAGILWGNSMSVFATEKTMASEKTNAEQEEVDVITGFQEPEPPYYEWKEKYSLEEVLSKLPGTLTVELDGERKEEIPVTWKCMDDYDATQFRVYEFLPYWDEDKYLLSNELDEYWDVPYIQITVPVAITEDEQKAIDVARQELQTLLKRESIPAAVYLCEQYDVKEKANAESKTVVSLLTGTTVQIKDFAIDECRVIWYQVSCEFGEQSYTGYIEKEHLAYSYEAFREWEERYSSWLSMYNTLESANASSNYADVEQFPESYQSKLMSLKRKHPNWIFVKQNTGLNWERAVKEEGVNSRSIISATMGTAYKGKFYSPGWCYASDQAISYYMDPRNFLDEAGIFQFEQLTFKSSYHNETEVLSADYILNGQDTLYLQKFNVDGRYRGLYEHQNTQNVCAPYTESYDIKEAYTKADVLENAYVFKIPVYNHMPEKACPTPVETKKAIPVINPAEDLEEAVDTSKEEEKAEEQQKQVIAKMSNDTVVDKQMLQNIKKNGTHMFLSINDTISWRIDGSSIISDTLSDIDFGVKIGESQIPEDKLKELTAGEDNYLELSLAHEGVFGFDAVLAVNLPTAEQGQYANLFYYNEQTEQFEFVCAAPVSGEKQAAFTFIHASDYVIVVNDNTMEAVIEEIAMKQQMREKLEMAERRAKIAARETPAKETGRAVGIIVGIIGASMVIVLCIFKASRKKNKKDTK